MSIVMAVMGTVINKVINPLVKAASQIVGFFTFDTTTSKFDTTARTWDEV